MVIVHVDGVGLLGAMNDDLALLRMFLRAFALVEL